MAKDLSMMMVQCLLPTSQSHALDKVLEQLGAREVMFRPYRNGAAEAPSPEKMRGATLAEASSRIKGKGRGAQQDWIVKNMKGETTAADLRPKWVAAGFPPGSLWGAISRSIAQKQIKKVKPGLYRPVAKG